MIKNTPAQPENENLLSKQLELEKIATTISTRFIHIEEEQVNTEIHAALKRIGIHAEIDRSYLFLYNHEKEEMSNTHEWCEEGISPEIDNLQNLPKNLFPWWTKKIENNEIIYLHTLADLPEEATKEKNILEAQHIKSLLVVPVFHSGKATGFIGFDAVKSLKTWRDADIRMLQLVADILGSTFQKLELYRTIREYNKDLEKLVEERTRENDEISFLNNAIVNTTGAIIFSVDPDGTILSMNPVAEKRLGYESSEVIHIKKTEDFYFPEELTSLTQELKKKGILHLNTPQDVLIHLAKHTSSPIEFNLKTKKGKSFPVLLSINPIYDQHGEIKQYAGVATDLGSKKEADKALLLQKAAFENFVYPLIITDVEGKIVWVNGSYSRLTGYSKEKMKGRTIGELQRSGRQKKEYYGEMWNTLLQGKVWKGELTNRKKDGSLYPEEITITPVKDKKGKFIHFVAIKIDLTEKKKEEEQLRQSEARWQFALESSGDGIWDWNVKTGKVYFSEQWKRMLGYDKSDMFNSLQDWEKRVHPGDREKMQEDMKKHLSGKTPVYINKHRLLCRNRNYKWILARGKVIRRDEKGTPERIIGTHTDISEQKHLEASLGMALEREKELNELKSRFISMVSHELRTPIASLLMTTETLETYRNRMSEEEIALKIGRIKNNIHSLKNIIDKTLNFSRLERGKMKFVPIKTKLNTFLESIIKKFAGASLVNHQIEFKKSKPPLEIKIDRQMINQVLINLLTNSYKFSPPGSTITVRAYEKSNNAVIEISDQGIGIPEDEKEMVFETFKRGSNSVNIHGTGLGLSISREFIRYHGGDINVESILNQETTFFITLPGIIHKTQ